MAYNPNDYGKPITLNVFGTPVQVKPKATQTFVDQYGTTQHAYNAQQKQDFLQMQKDQRIRNDLNLYNQYAMKYLPDLQRMFGQQVNYGIGQATGNAMSQVNQFLTRRGIDPRRSGIAQSLQAQQLGNLQQQGQQAQLNYSQKLYEHMQQDQNAIITGDLTYFQALERMNYNNELNKDMARFQQNLQRDNARWQALGSVLGLGGQVLTGLFGGGMSDLNYNGMMNNMMQATPQPDANMQPVYG